MNIHLNETAEAEEQRLRSLLGDAEYDQLASEDDSHIQTVAIGRAEGHENIFLMFQDRKEIEYLISQLANMLTHDDLQTSIRGRVMAFGEWCDANAEEA